MIGILNNKNIQIAAIVLLLIGVGFYTGIFSMSIITNDQCTTEHKWNPTEADCNWVGNAREHYEELILYPQDTIELVTAWQTGADSVPVTVSGEVTQVKPCVGGWNVEDGWYLVEMNTGSGWTRILETGDGANSYTDSAIIKGFVGSPSVQKYADTPIGGILFPQWFGDFIHRSMKSIVFELSGPRVGALRVTQMTNYWEPYHLTPTPLASSIDHIYLISGAGDLTLVDPKTRYIAGVDSVQFNVNTGASGQTQGEGNEHLGWTLSLHDSNGDLAKEWLIPDNSRGVIKSFPIPEDAVNEGQSHKWTATLNNALFDQKEVKTFVITKAELEQCPDIKQITFSKSKYMLGDTVTLNMEGIPNTIKGNGIIDGFEVTISYGGGTDWVGEYHDYYVSASNNKGSVVFKPIRGDIKLVAEVWAFDGTPTSGGLMSEKSYAEVYVQDEVPQLEGGIWVFVIAIIIGVIMLVVGAMLPMNVYIKMLLIISGIVIVAATILYYYGYI